MAVNMFFAMLFLACLFGMLEYRKRCQIAESYARNAHKLYRQSFSVIESLNAKIVEQNDQITMLQGIYHSTYATMKDSYNTMKESYKTLKSSSSNGNGNKDNGNNNHKTQPTPAVSKSATLADLGTITPREQSMIDKWHKDNTPDSECVKRITNIRNSEAKRAKVA